MKKRIIASVLAAATLSLGVFSGCFLTKVSVVSIEKSNSVGLVDYYTITYSDGTTSQFTVTNGASGKDGESAKDVTAEDVYATYKEIYGEELTYKEFCEKYLTFTADGNAALNSCLRSCLKVYTVFREKMYFDNTTIFKGYGDAAYGGSAVIYKMESDYTYLLTNYHVIYDEYAAGTSKFPIKMWAYLYGSESEPVRNSSDEYVVNDDYAISCQYVGGEIAYDVAVIKARTEDVLAVNPQAVPVTVSYEYSVGDNTYAIGNPNLNGLSVTEGIISVESDYIALEIDGTKRAYRSIRTDTALTHGNSGGGLFNMNGELIGLNNAGDKSVSSMNYAIPASALTGIADGILYYNGYDPDCRNTRTARLGVTVQSKNSRYVYDESTGKGTIREELVVKEVEKSDNLARLLGLASGDVLKSITINGKTHSLYRQFQLSDLLLTVRAGDNISITYERGGQEAQTQTVAARGLTDIIEIPADKNVIDD